MSLRCLCSNLREKIEKSSKQAIDESINKSLFIYPFILSFVNSRALSSRSFSLLLLSRIIRRHTKDPSVPYSVKSILYYREGMSIDDVSIVEETRFISTRFGSSVEIPVNASFSWDLFTDCAEREKAAREMNDIELGIAPNTFTLADRI